MCNLVNVVVSDEEKNKIRYVGRLLGLANQDSFQSIITDKVIANKIKTAATTPLSEVANKIETTILQDGNDNLEKLRLVVALKQINKTSAYNTLFISGIIEDVASILTDDYLSIITMDNSTIHVNNVNKTV